MIGTSYPVATKSAILAAFIQINAEKWGSRY